MKGNVMSDHFRVGRAVGLLGLLSLLLACSAPEAPDTAGPVADWPVVGADNGGSRYSPLTQIDRRNVARLKVAWEYRSGDVPAKGDAQLSALQATPIVVDGVDYGAPIENLKAAMRDAGIDAVDLWIGTGGLPVAQLVVPVLKPKAHIPIHWDGLWEPFEQGMPWPFSDPADEAYLAKAGVRLLKPGQYMDKWRLDRSGIRPVPNTAIKRALGFSDVQAFR